MPRHMLAMLVVARLGQPPCDSEDQCDCVLGDGARIDARGARQADALGRGCSLGYWSMPELIDWMNLSLPACGIQVVLPHARDHHDIGLADALLEPS